MRLLERLTMARALNAVMTGRRDLAPGLAVFRVQPDGWEIKYGFDPNVNDAGGDIDRDGLANLYEYLHGANPLKGYITCGGNGPFLSVITPWQ